MKKLFPILFILTGIFAILGALYTWGDGNIFTQHELVKVLISWADIVFTGPLSILAGIGLLHEKKMGEIVGFGSKRNLSVWLDSGSYYNDLE